MDPALIQFENLNGFPLIENHIETEAFLCAANEIVAIIESFGTIFSPVATDMNGNVKKLKKVFESDCIKFHYLEDLINNNYTGDAMLWLKRGLKVICIFFENILNDTARAELIKRHLQDAYDRILKPHHNFIVKHTIKIMYNWVPTRSQLLGSGMEQEKNLQILAVYLPRMRQNLLRIDAILQQYKLNMSL